ncbi:MAG TPA: hypothetical protein VGW38_23380 [Chloroflexota bacterium]|nr:hypothetical protein [Chloroflexota bacterium]
MFAGDRLRAAAPDLVVIVSFTLLTAWATYPLLASFTTALPGDGGDSWQFYWNLWWIKRAVLDLHTWPYFSADVHYPFGSPLYFHTLLLFPGLLALPIVAGLGLTPAYNSLVLLSFIAGGYGAYRLLLYLLASAAVASVPVPAGVSHAGLKSGGTGSSLTPGDVKLPSGRLPIRLAAFTGGVVFAFSSYHFIHLLGHLDLVSLQWIPLYALFLFKSWRQCGRQNPLLAALFLAATALTSWYYGMHVLGFTVLFAVYHLLADRGRHDLWPAASRLGLATGLGLVLLSPVLLPMLRLGQAAGLVADPAGDAQRYSIDLLALVVPSPLHSLWGPTVRAVYQCCLWGGGGTESVAFLGFAPLLLAAWALRPIWAHQRFWLLVLGVFSVLALGPVLHIGGRAVTISDQPVWLPYQLLMLLPYGGIARLPSRAVVMITLAVAVLAGYASYLLFNRLRQPQLVLVVFGCLTGLLLLENLSTPYPSTVVATPPLYAELARDYRRVALLEVPVPDDPSVYPRRMLYQTEHGKPSYGGYLSRGLPPLLFDGLPGFAQFKTLAPELDDIVRYDPHEFAAVSRFVLNLFNAGYIVIDKVLLDAAQLDRARQVATSLFDDTAPVYEDELTLAYAVPTAPAPRVGFIFPERGWYGLERLQPGMPADHPPRWRWMPEQAQLGLFSPEEGRWHLQLRAWSFARPRRLEIVLDATPLATLEVQPQPAIYQTPTFVIPAGRHAIRLRSLDGADRPATEDRRLLSVAIAELKLRR